MERCPLTLSASLLIACAPAALAASSTDLSVTGIITPNACVITLSDGGIVKHDNVKARNLDPVLPTRLPTGELQIQVHCGGDTRFTLTTLDNRAGTSAINPAFHGLGEVNDGEKLGSVAFGLFEPLADGKSVRTIMSRDDGATWGLSTYLGHAGLTAFAAPGGPPHKPVAIRDLSARLRAFTIIAPAAGLTLLDELPINGHATLQLKYW